ncbi:PREDICTED: uncharacterized protein LOC106906753 [Poecilia mexicana]|uniref:uncharacterized protein LOC106906753 n=1 Tax=Poecilia mexicana TaxID=48701 RepID=UPI00072EE252|nr:PREDICTED: uncharacterized protein LOC106906753 [Poecilia mexicana]
MAAFGAAAMLNPETNRLTEPGQEGSEAGSRDQTFHKRVRTDYRKSACLLEPGQNLELVRTGPEPRTRPGHSEPLLKVEFGTFPLSGFRTDLRERGAALMLRWRCSQHRIRTGNRNLTNQNGSVVLFSDRNRSARRRRSGAEGAARPEGNKVLLPPGGTHLQPRDSAPKIQISYCSQRSTIFQDVCRLTESLTAGRYQRRCGEAEWADQPFCCSSSSAATSADFTPTPRPISSHRLNILHLQTGNHTTQEAAPPHLLLLLQNLARTSTVQGSEPGQNWVQIRTGSRSKPGSEQNRVQSRTGTGSRAEPGSDQNRVQIRTGSRAEPGPEQNRVQIKTGFRSEPGPDQNRVQIRTGSRSEPGPEQNRDKDRTENKVSSVLVLDLAAPAGWTKPLVPRPGLVGPGLVSTRSGFITFRFNF